MKILIELPSWLGDTVMATPAIENLIGFYDSSEFTLVGSANSIEILKNHPQISNTFVLKKKYSSTISISRELSDFDKFFSFRNTFRSYIFRLLVRSKQKSVFKKSAYKKIHQVEKYTNFINNSLKTKLTIGPLKIYQSNLSKNKYKDPQKKPQLGINPGASYGSAKRWYPEEFSKVIIELSDRYDITILGGVKEKEIAFDIQRLIEKKGVTNYKNLAGKLSIAELISYISRFDLFITGDSGPMHIAAAFKIPTVSIFGPTKDIETSQWKNKNSIILKKNLPCRPCMKRECPLGHHNCMRLIKAKDVLTEIHSLSL